MIEFGADFVAYDVYILACDESGGIYHYKLNKDKIEEKQFYPIKSPMYAEISDNRLYCVLRDPLGNGSSAIVSFSIDSDGNLTDQSEMISTKGIVGCHLTVKDNEVFVANYVSGSVFKTPDVLVTHSGKGVHPIRQTSPHTHCTVLTPDGKYLCVADLGLDKVFIYDTNLKKIDEICFPSGSGPRHIVFSDDGKYMFCITELSNQVFSFKYLNGKFEKISIINTLPDDFSGENTAAAIRIKDNYLYASNRGHNSIAVYEITDGNLNLLDIVNCGGVGPRDFNIIDDLIVCTNENSNTVTFLKLENNIPKLKDFSLKMPNPLNVVFKER